MAANAALARPALVPGTYAGLGNAAEHVSCAALVNWREQTSIDEVRAADAREARALELLDEWIDRAAADGGFATRECRQGHRIVAYLRALNTREDVAHATIDAHNRHERTHEGAASHALDDALLAVEAKRNGHARDEALSLLHCPPPGQLALMLLGEEE